MKSKGLTYLIFLGCIAYACGCVRSIHPFYTDKRIIVAPEEILGRWQLVTDDISSPKGLDKEDLSDVEPWTIGKDQAITYDGSNRVAALQTTYFRIQDTLYCDTTVNRQVGGASCSNNTYSMTHELPVHMLFRLDLTQDTLVLRTLRVQKPKQVLGTNSISLAEEGTEEDWLFTASSGQWVDFLKMHGDDSGTFSSETIVLQRGAEARADGKR